MGERYPSHPNHLEIIRYIDLLGNPLDREAHYIFSYLKAAEIIQISGIRNTMDKAPMMQVVITLDIFFLISCMLISPLFFISHFPSGCGNQADDSE